MPIYDLQCLVCKKKFDYYKLKKKTKPVCPECKNRKGFKRLVSRSSFILKGSGWGKND